LCSTNGINYNEKLYNIKRNVLKMYHWFRLNSFKGSKLYLFLSSLRRDIYVFLGLPFIAFENGCQTI